MNYFKKTIIWYLLLIWSIGNYLYGYEIATCHGGIGDSSTLLFIPIRLHCAVHNILPIIFLIGLIVASIIVLRKKK